MRSTSRRTRPTSRPSTPTPAPIAVTSSSANYVYELPFFRDSPNSPLKACWRLADGRHHLRSIRASRCRASRRTPTTSSAAARRPSSAIPAPASRRRNCIWFNPTRLRAGGRRHLRQLGRVAVPAAGPQSDRPHAVEELLARRARQRSSSGPTRSTRSTRCNWASDPSATGLDNTCTISLTTCTGGDRHVRPARSPRARRARFSSA